MSITLVIFRAFNTIQFEIRVLHFVIYLDAFNELFKGAKI